MTYANGTADPVGLDATRFETRIGHEGYVRRLPERVTRTITASKLEVTDRFRRIRDGRLVVHMSMGAWRSEATLERGDLPYVGVAASLLFGTFYMGRQSVKIALKARELGSR